MADVHKNEVHLAGEVVRAPEVRYTPTGKAVSRFTVLTKYQQSTEYHRVTCWEALAEKAGKLNKDEFIKIVGRLQTRSWEDPATKSKRYSTEIVAWQIVVPSRDKAIQNDHGVTVTDADIPF